MEPEVGGELDSQLLRGNNRPQYPCHSNWIQGWFIRAGRSGNSSRAIEPGAVLETGAR